MLGEHLPGPADEPSGGLVAGGGQHVGVRQDFDAREATARAGFVFELDREQVGHEVVGGVLGAPVDVLREHPRDVGQGVHFLDLRYGLVELEAGADAVTNLLLVGLRNAEQQSDDPHGHLRAEIADEIEPFGVAQRVERVRAELAHLRLDRQHPFRREHARQQRAVQVVDRGILEQDVAGPQLDVGADQLEDRAPAGPKGVPVAERILDVVETAHCEEVVLLVVVERLLLAHPPPDRVGVDVDVEVVRVVVQVAVGRECHSEFHLVYAGMWACIIAAPYSSNVFGRSATGAVGITARVSY